MYGTIAKMRLNRANVPALVTLLADQTSQIEGILGSEVLVAEESDVAWLVVRFTDKAAYVANAESPEQNERYLQMRALLSDDPEWHDGEWETP